MRPPSFWWREASLAATLLTPLAALYGAVAARRLAAPGRDVGIPVICVGNLDARWGRQDADRACRRRRLLQAAGATPVFLSRGYGGSLAGPVRVEPARHTAADGRRRAAAAGTPCADGRGARPRRWRANFARARGRQRRGHGRRLSEPIPHQEPVHSGGGRPRGIGNGRVFPAGPAARAPPGAACAGACHPGHWGGGEAGRGQDGRLHPGCGTGAEASGFPGPAHARPSRPHRRYRPTGAGVCGDRQPGEILCHAGSGRDRICGATKLPRSPRLYGWRSREPGGGGRPRRPHAGDHRKGFRAARRGPGARPAP